MKIKIERGSGNWGRMLACLGAGVFMLVVVSGCGGGTAPKSSEGVVQPGTMGADQQKQYQDQMKNRGNRPGAGPGMPTGMPMSRPGSPQ